MTTVDTYPITDPKSERNLAAFRKLIDTRELPSAETDANPDNIIRALIFDDASRPKAAAQINFDPELSFGLLTVNEGAEAEDVIELVEALRPEVEWRGLDKVLIYPTDDQREMYLALGFEDHDPEDDSGFLSASIAEVDISL